MQNKIDLTDKEWSLILGCLEEKINKLNELEWPLNQMAATMFVEVHSKIASLLK